MRVENFLHGPMEPGNFWLNSVGASDSSAASKDSSAWTSSVVEISSADNPSNSEPEATPSPPPAKTEFRQTAVCVGQSSTHPVVPAAIDVDAESSLVPLPHLLSEGDFLPMDMEVAFQQEKESRTN